MNNALIRVSDILKDLSSHQVVYIDKDYRDEVRIAERALNSMSIAYSSELVNGYYVIKILN